jgi:hypothetical protein
MNQVTVKKSTGEEQSFSPQKIELYLKKVQVPQVDIDIVMPKILDFCDTCDGKLTTRKIAKRVNSELKKLENGSLYSARYFLRENLRKMGPGGHYFEDYVGSLFRAQGFDVQVGVVLDGHCVSHEIDIIAEKDNRINYMEAKFHNRDGIRSDVTVAMYSYARYEDLSSVAPGNKSTALWLVTNTKLTFQAIDYANCKGITILNLEYPKGAGIQALAIQYGLYPISSIGAIYSHRRELYEAGVVTTKDFVEFSKTNGNILNIPDRKFNSALEIAKRINLNHINTSP